MMSSWSLIVAAAAPGGTIDVEALLARQQAEVRATIRDGACRTAPDPAGSGGAIVVCGSRAEEDDRHRIGTSVPDGTPRETAGRAQMRALEAGSNPCTAVGRDQRCSGGLDVMAAGATLLRGLRNALDRRD
jgi:hypothetical protein